MKKEQEEALRVQDEKMVTRVETRLTEIQDDFLIRTEKAAQTIFEQNHVHVLSELDKTNGRVDYILAYHKTQKEMFDKLTAHNEEAIVLHNQIRKIFKEES